MRASLIIASHNEGAALGNTIESCIASCHGLDYEIVVVDDASTDGSAEDIERRFPQVRLHRQPQRVGASPAKALGARHARGEVLVFLDGHCFPEGAALARLIDDVERVKGDAVTPQIPALDVKSWRNDPDRVGNGYTLDLLTLQCEWQSLDQMRPMREAGLQFFESAALIGCVFAVGRQVYEQLWGFDPQMRYWGVEDIDFGLKCWLMGRRILHDPKAVVGHQFQSRFDKYSVPAEHVIVNELRTGRKHLTHTVWEEWLQLRRSRVEAQGPGYPEGLWARAWHLFQNGISSVEQERSYLHARRIHDEFWYARRFKLDWPKLQSRVAGSSTLTPHVGPSPSPVANCQLTGVSPASASLFAGEPQQFVAQGSNLAAVTWTTSASANPATGTGPSFTTRWSAIGNQTVTATCGGVSKSVTVRVHSLDIQINNTPATNDDLVILNSTHPPRQFNVNCQMRLLGPSAGNVNVVLTNPDGRLRFPNPPNTTLNLTLDAGGAFSAFAISGAAASATIGDAVIHVRLNTATGPEITTKKVTVVSFDNAAVPLTQGGNYAFAGASYTVTGTAAVLFTSSARIRPAGVDCTAPQLVNLRMAIMQESSIKLIKITWDTPTIAWLPATAAGTSVTVETTTRRTITYDPAVVQPVNDGLAGAFPLYDNSATALTPATGCAGAGTAGSNDTPTHTAGATQSRPQQNGAGVTVGTVTWNNRVNTTRVQHFRTFCVVFDQVTNQFFSLREATWDINLDSAAATPQHATVNAHGPATANPAATLPQSNNAPLITTDSAVGAATTTFVK
jgi:glycosyltransferase involved in cell wall biosynthesis